MKPINIFLSMLYFFGSILLARAAYLNGGEAFATVVLAVEIFGFAYLVAVTHFSL